MEYKYIEKRYNTINLTSINAFANISGKLSDNCKDVFFMRLLGVNATYQKDIESMDESQTKRADQGAGIYQRILGFPGLVDAEEIDTYMRSYYNWKQGNQMTLYTKRLVGNAEFAKVMSTACSKVLALFREKNPSISESMEKNFMVKLLFWLDVLGYEYLREWNPKQSMKCVLHNVSKEHEFYFCYLLTLFGIDVLLLQNERDIDDKAGQLEISKKVILGDFASIKIAPYDKEKYKIQVQVQTVCEPIRPAISLPTHPQEVRHELEFEKLALLASSVVMISIHDSQGKVMGSGSGIMVGRAGYILTNNHVACRGNHYSVRIEDDEKTYETTEIIKYNPVLDLAIIRIQRELKPLPVYQGEKKLVRGQKVVAIGSPLGLFNSVSDGIISGFRKIDDVDMIQFTAPISQGSSGGAVLNMYGEVIGISTAEIDAGQNINLAVGYEFINSFIRGFL